MRKLLLTTAAVAGEAAFGTFTDTRDGQTYKTVKIGGQRWMAENLNYHTDSSWCYENSVDSCAKYGRLYNWNAAKKACPAIYHLPSHKEWINLAETVGGKRYIDTRDGSHQVYWDVAGKMLKTKHGWREDRYNNRHGTDNFGFSTLPGGYRFLNGRFDLIDGRGDWWTATADGNYSAYIMRIKYNQDDLFEHNLLKDLSLSVRCVADRPRFILLRTP